MYLSTYLFRVEHLFCCHLPHFSTKKTSRLQVLSGSPINAFSVLWGCWSSVPFGFLADPSRSTMVHPRKCTKNVVSKKQGRMLKGNEILWTKHQFSKDMLVFRRVMLGKHWLKLQIYAPTCKPLTLISWKSPITINRLFKTAIICRMDSNLFPHVLPFNKDVGSVKGWWKIGQSSQKEDLWHPVKCADGNLGGEGREFLDTCSSPRRSLLSTEVSQGFMI